MNARALPWTLAKHSLLDVLLLGLVWYVPTLSHLVSFPLYLLDPMRLVVFAALVISGRGNALVVALALPLFSHLTSGHPVVPKLFLIQAELAANVLLFARLRHRDMGFAGAAVLSTLAAKALYYAAKAALIQAALLHGPVVSTPWRYQIAVVAIIVVGGSLALRLRRES